MPIAHTENARGARQDLIVHLMQVADLSAEFAAAFDARELGYLVGQLHDIGKFNLAFQQYLLDAEANPNGPRPGPDHKGVGALHATRLRQDALSRLLVSEIWRLCGAGLHVILGSTRYCALTYTKRRNAR